MIWFFLAGWISGAVAVIMYIMWFVRTHAKRVTPSQLRREIEQEEEKSND